MNAFVSWTKYFGPEISSYVVFSFLGRLLSSPSPFNVFVLKLFSLYKYLHFWKTRGGGGGGHLNGNNEIQGNYFLGSNIVSRIVVLIKP